LQHKEGGGEKNYVDEEKITNLPDGGSRGGRGDGLPEGYKEGVSAHQHPDSSRKGRLNGSNTPGAKIRKKN